VSHDRARIVALILSVDRYTIGPNPNPDHPNAMMYDTKKSPYIHSSLLSLHPCSKMTWEVIPALIIHTNHARIKKRGAPFQNFQMFCSIGMTS
jgi:hypothetical protein